MSDSISFVTLFKHLGRSWGLQDEDNKELKTFTCRLYASSHDNDSDTRYKIYCGARGKFTLIELPPRQNRVE